jgi:hypothetical protein
MNRVAKITAWAMENYEEGGHWIVETFISDEIYAKFKTIKQAKDYCQMMEKLKADRKNS